MQPSSMHSAIIRRMPINLHIRDVPDTVHSALTARAERRGMSLRQYAIRVLEEHCALPAVDDWLDELAAMPPAGTAVGSAAEAVRRSREEDDSEVLRGRRGA